MRFKPVNIINLTGITLGMLMATSVIYAQNFEGRIVYKVDPAGIPPNELNLPLEYEFYFKADSIYIKLDWGDKNDLVIGDFMITSSSLLMIDHDAKLVTRISLQHQNDNDKLNRIPPEYRRNYQKALRDQSTGDITGLKMEASGHFDEIAGHVCELYYMELPDNTLRQKVWLSREFNFNIPFKPGILSQIPLIQFSTEYGFPMKVELNLKDVGTGYLNPSLTAAHIEEGTPDGAIFIFPAEYYIQDLSNLLRR